MRSLAERWLRRAARGAGIQIDAGAAGGGRELLEHQIKTVGSPARAARAKCNSVTPSNSSIGPGPVSKKPHRQGGSPRREIRLMPACCCAFFTSAFFFGLLWLYAMAARTKMQGTRVVRIAPP